MLLLQSLVYQPALTGLGGNTCKIVRTRREAEAYVIMEWLIQALGEADKH